MKGPSLAALVMGLGSCLGWLIPAPLEGPSVDRVWNPLWNPEDLQGATADQLAREKHRWDLAMERDEPEDRPRPPLATAVQVLVRTPTTVAGIGDDLNTRWRLSAEAPGVFRGWISLERKSTEVLFPAHRHFAFAMDRFAPRWSLFAGDLDLKVGDGLVFRSLPESPATHTWQRPPEEGNSRVDLDGSWSPGPRRGLALCHNPGPFSFGVFFLSMPMDGRVDEGDGSHPFIHAPTTYPSPLPRSPDLDDGVKEAVSQNITGFWTGWHRPGISVEGAGVLVSRPIPYLPENTSGNVPGYQGRTSGSGTVAIHLGDNHRGLQATVAGNLHPSAPIPGGDADGSPVFSPALRVHGFVTLGGIQYQTGGRAWVDGFAPVQGRGFREDVDHPAQGLFYLQGRTGGIGAPPPTQFRFGFWERLTGGAPPLALLHGGLSREEGPLHILGEASLTLPSSGVPGQVRVSATGEWRGRQDALRLQGNLALTNLELSGSAQIQWIWRPSPAVDTRVTLGLRRGQGGYLFDAAGVVDVLPSTPAAVWHGGLRFRVRPRAPFSFEFALNGTMAAGVMTWALSSGLVIGCLPDTWEDG